MEEVQKVERCSFAGVSHGAEVPLPDYAMNVGEVSRSALSAAVARGTHRLWDPPPWIIEDPFALILVGPGWPELASAIRSLMPTEVFRGGHLFVQIRSRYCEDRLLGSGCSQYVLLGAGLDTFAWRRPDLLGRLRVFEVDHPATQTWKRARAEELGLPANPAVRYVPVDLNEDDLEAALVAHGFEMAAPSVFASVGTTMYLHPGALLKTLRFVARCAPGSEIAFSYNVTPELMDPLGVAFLEAIKPKVAAQGEPILSGFTPSQVSGVIAGCDLSIDDHPTSEDLWFRYCRDRGEQTRPYTVERLVTAQQGR